MTDLFLLQLFSESAVSGAAEAENTGGPEAVQTDTAEDCTEAAGSDEEFEELIKGKFKDAFRKRTQGIIEKRLGKYKSCENTIRVCAPLFERIAADFPHIAPEDTEGLVRAFLQREDETKKTDGQRVLLENVEEKLSLRAAERLRDRLAAESEGLKEIYPSFDLTREISSSPELTRLLAAGIPLRRAYECVNLDKIMGSALRYAVSRTAGNTAEALRSRTRIQENSLSDRASSVKRTDVKSLTERDIMRIISEVGKGAKITF